MVLQRRPQLHICIYIIVLETTDLWDIDGKFSLKVISAGNLNVSKDASVSLLYASLLFVLLSPILGTGGGAF